MLFLLSPAKTLDYESPLPDAVQPLLAAAKPGSLTPQFQAEAATLVDVLRGYTPQDIARLMELSPDLAMLNVRRFANWSARATARNSRPALLAFNGDVYEGMDARSLSTDDLAWAQQHLRILSGLYGVLKPLDRLQPYRLEMGRPLPTPRGKHLYAFWGDRVANELNRLQAHQADPVIVNLASVEYARVTLARAGQQPVLKARVLQCQFEDWKNGDWKVISFHAKRARGLMARYAITRRITDPAALDAFAEEGYAIDLDASTPDTRVFRRRT